MQRYCLITIPFHIQKIIKLRNLVRCSPSRRLSQQPFTGGIVHVFTISLCAPLPDEAAEAPRVREFVKVTQQVGKGWVSVRDPASQPECPSVLHCPLEVRSSC